MTFSWEDDRQTDNHTDTQTDKVTTREACASKNKNLGFYDDL